MMGFVLQINYFVNDMVNFVLGPIKAPTWRLCRIIYSTELSYSDRTWPEAITLHNVHASLELLMSETKRFENREPDGFKAIKPI